MTVTFSLWMLFPAACFLGAFILLVIGSRDSGMLAGLFEGLAAFALIVIAVAFLIGRWLA